MRLGLLITTLKIGNHHSEDDLSHRLDILYTVIKFFKRKVSCIIDLTFLEPGNPFVKEIACLFIHLARRPVFVCINLHSDSSTMNELRIVVVIRLVMPPFIYPELLSLSSNLIPFLFPQIYLSPIAPANHQTTCCSVL